VAPGYFISDTNCWVVPDRAFTFGLFKADFH
jgi:hypothetical protein